MRVQHPVLLRQQESEVIGVERLADQAREMHDKLILIARCRTRRRHPVQQGQLLQLPLLPLLRLFALGEIDHEAAQLDGHLAAHLHAHHVAQPDGAAVLSQEAILEGVRLPPSRTLGAVLRGPGAVLGVQVIGPELQIGPLRRPIAQQGLDLGRDVGPAIQEDIVLPQHRGRALRQPPVLLLALAQLSGAFAHLHLEVGLPHA